MTAHVAGVIEHEIGAAGLLAIRLHSSDVRVRGIEGSTVRIQDADGTLSRSTRIERGPGSLSLSADRGISIGIGSVGFAVGRHVGDVEIEAPFGTTIVVETASGDIAVDGLTGDQRYRSASGDLELRQVCGRLTIESMSGDVTIGTAGDSILTARTVSGDLSIRGDAALPSARIATTSGEIRLEGRFEGGGPYTVDTVSGDTVIAPTGGLRLEIKSVTGDVSSELESTSAGSRGTRTVVIGSGGPTVAFRSISGDLRIVAHRVGQAPSATTVPSLPESPVVPALVEPPIAPEAPTESIVTDSSMAILEALERGEIDVSEASRRLAAFDAAGETGAPA